ncbi:hypothetical protein OAE71_02390, partial [Synechococcus sp. AH-551-A21]|nr:hypothetical protein [Synechococcus sp. AH-551-A21]
MHFQAHAPCESATVPSLKTDHRSLDQIDPDGSAQWLQTRTKGHRCYLHPPSRTNRHQRLATNGG